MHTTNIHKPLTSPNSTPATALTYIGIDNGTTGAIACLPPSDKVICAPVVVQDLGREKLLDTTGNLALLRRMAAGSGVALENCLVVIEQAQINPKFGAHNNYTNGRNNEFWRVLLSMAGIPFCWSNPRTWQKAIFAGIRGDDTKEMADLIRRQRFPSLDFTAHNKKQQLGINDALCIALWARQTLR